jgi:hypothetical protein
MSEGNRPLQTFKSSAAFSLSVSVWRGQKGYSITTQKRIKRESGEYEEVKSLFANEALTLAALLERAVEWGDKWAEAEYQAGKAAGGTAPENNFKQMPAGGTVATPSAIDEDEIPF